MAPTTPTKAEGFASKEDFMQTDDADWMDKPMLHEPSEFLKESLRKRQELQNILGLRELPSETTLTFKTPNKSSWPKELSDFADEDVP
jgi:hypothetical protein